MRSCVFVIPDDRDQADFVPALHSQVGVLTGHLEGLDRQEETSLELAGMSALCGKNGIPLMSTRTVNTAECAAPHTIVRKGHDP